MKRIFTAVFILSVISALIYGQTPSFYVNQTTATITDSANNNTTFDTRIYVYNNTSSPLTLKWTRKNVNIPNGWQTAVCDVAACYPPSQNSGNMVLPANGDNYIQFHFYPYNIGGTGSADVDILLSSTSELLTISFTGNAIPTPSGIKEISITAFSIVPNPAADFLYVTNIAAKGKEKFIEVYDVLGKKLISHFIAKEENSASIHIASLPKGVYFARLRSDKENVAVKTFVKD